MATILVTGTAGFIGFHLAKHLLDRGDTVIGYDNVNDYYDPALKEARINILEPYENYTFYKADLCDRETMEKVVKDHDPEVFVNLAAQAGVRHSLSDPYTYQKSNLEGFLNVLETCRHSNVKNLVYASSSSVFGGNTKIPFSVEDNVDQPVSFYAATKKSNELMAHSYSHLYGMNTTGLRFFTVYGP
jgi:UDP-glucuronate 4-epimerase